MADTELNLEAERAAYLAAFPDVHFSGAWTARNEQDFAVWMAARRTPPAVERQGEAERDESSVYLATKAAAPADAPKDLPAELFDGHAVYSEITRHLGKGHCHNPDTVSATLDALARLIRARRASSVPAIPGTGGGEELLAAIADYRVSSMTADRGDAKIVIRYDSAAKAEAAHEALCRAPSHPLEAKAGEFRCAEYNPDDHDSCQFDKGTSSICQRCGVERAKAGEDA